MTRPWEKVDIQVCTDCLLTVAGGLPEDLAPGRAQAITTGIASGPAAAGAWRSARGRATSPGRTARCAATGEVGTDTRRGQCAHPARSTP